MPNETRLQKDYTSWTKWSKEKTGSGGSKFRPIVPVSIEYEEFKKCFDFPLGILSFSDMCSFASEVFNRKVRTIIDNALDKKLYSLVLPEYIHLLTEEIGQDKIFDVSSIYFVGETPGFERKEVVFENERLFFEYALAIASAYAVIFGVENVLYEKDSRYAWS